MSKKYRLFREFPGSPDYGTVVLKGSSSDPNPELYGDERNNFFFSSKDVENYPEFWEEEKEPFVSYDGIELFGGERAYLVTDTLLNGVLLGYSIEDFKNTKGKIFAEKENSEKYIRDNEKKYSLNDMIEIANHWAYIKNLVTPEKVLKYLEKKNNYGDRNG